MEGWCSFTLKRMVLHRKGRSRSLYFTVMNTLRGSYRQLPPTLNVTDVTMKHFMVNRETNCYKVLIMVNRGGEGDTESALDIQVFDSETGEWSQRNEATNIMFGNQSAHDFASGRSFELDEYWPETNDKTVESYTFLKDRLYELRKDTDGPASDVPTNRPSMMYYIREDAVEYHPQHRRTWSAVDTHRRVPFEHIPERSGIHRRMTLLSRNGFLVVFSAIRDPKPDNRNPGRMYDLATRTWRELPKLPGSALGMSTRDSICEIRWNAHA